MIRTGRTAKEAIEAALKDGSAVVTNAPKATKLPTVGSSTAPMMIDPSRYMNEIPEENVLFRATRLGDPSVKQRPRFSSRSGRVYTPGATKDHQEAIASLARSHIGISQPDGEWAFGIRAVFYAQTHQRKDVDNMLKVVLDGLNKVAFADDSQVKEIMGWSLFDEVNPRTEMVVYRMHKIDRDKGTCVVCKKEFRKYKSWAARLYCSRRCLSVATTTSTVENCVRCEREFLMQPARKVMTTKNGRHYCSNACWSLDNRLQLTCGSCGTKFTRPKSQVKGGSFCSVKCYRAKQRL